MVKEKGVRPMLVLSREAGQEIVIGDGQVIVSVVCIRGDKVRIGITAAKDVAVHRREVFEAIQRERLEQQKKQNNGEGMQ